MRILSIETSCDETAISLVDARKTESGISFEILGNVTHSQVSVHQEFGGVFPALAKREHQNNLVPVLLMVLNNPAQSDPGRNNADLACSFLERERDLLEQFKAHVAGLENPSIEAICVTSGPGLEPALWVGINFAKALGALWNIPVVAVNHMEGHILSVIVPDVSTEEKKFEFKNEIRFPALALLISGGHTELVLAKSIGDYEIIGKTRDDAVGEAFDKVARILGLPYPGGPEISKLALQFKGEGNSATPNFPRPMITSPDLDFSFSGLKTAVLYYAQNLPQPLSQENKIAIAYEFENAVSEVLVKKTKKAIDTCGAQTLIVAGGVSANARIKSEFRKMIEQNFPETALLFPERELTGDNALMIALAGYFKIEKSPNAVYNDIRAEGNLIL